MQAVSEIRLVPAKVIVFSTRMAGQDSTSPQGFHPPTHGNWAQWAVVIISVLALLGLFGNIGLTLWFHHTAGESKASDEHVDTLINAKLTPALQAINDNTEKKLGPISSQLTDLATRVGKLEGRFEQLDSDQKRLTKLQLNKLSNQIAAVQRTKRLLQPTLVARLGDDVLAFTDSGDSEISSLAWHTAAQIADYRTTLNVEAARPFIAAVNETNKLSRDFYIEARVLDPTTAGFGIGFDSRKMVPFDQAARYEKLDNPLPRRDFGAAFYVASGTGVELLLDGYRLKNVVFHDVQISYGGGPLVMENVYFVNCTFHLQPNPNARQLTAAVLNSTSVTLNAARG